MLILFARECFVEECDELLNVELNESEIEELNLCLIHFQKIIEFKINLKERTCFLCTTVSTTDLTVGGISNTLVIEADDKSPRHRR